jgi:hypothetical protein
MASDAESANEVLKGLPQYRRKRLILRVESVGSEVNEWCYRASYPELVDFSVTSADVLEAILDLEAKLGHTLDGT